jgi:hypothetical protein
MSRIRVIPVKKVPDRVSLERIFVTAIRILLTNQCDNVTIRRDLS